MKMVQSEKTVAAPGILPAQEISRDVLLEKYAKGAETTSREVRAERVRERDSVTSIAVAGKSA